MSDFSLRLPYLVYLSIGSILVGVLVAPMFRDMPPMQGGETSAMAMAMAEHEHTTLDIPAAGAPALSIRVEPDPMQGWNVVLETRNFTFAPESAGGAHEDNTGHAHLYVDGMKVARLYGPHFHIPALPPGEHEITASLSTNDHAYFAVNGDRIEARATVVQDDPPLSGN